jgi:hypothetical protein
MMTPDKFWAKVRKTDTCWLWIGGLNSDGYGSVRLGSPTNAHVISWRLTNGEIPKGRHILHKCDVPNCVNPEHLFLGNHADNMRDKTLKDRAAKKLSREQVASIRSLCDSGLTQTAVAARYGIHQTEVSRIVKRKIWIHV